MYSSSWRRWIDRSASAVSDRRRRRTTRKPAQALDVERLEDRCLLANSLPGLAGYGQVPLSFEINQGQTDPQVSFLSHGSGYSLFLTPTEAVLHLQQPPDSSGGTPDLSAAAGDVVRMQLLGANPSPQIVGLDEQATTSNYLIGNDPSQWRTGIANFGKIAYHDVYPGIDLDYYGNQRQLEYDFVVSPGADPGAISFSFQGTTDMSVDGQGNLILHTSGGDVVEHAPVIYQDGPGGRQSVSGQYVLNGDGQVGFAVGAYDPSQTLVIDPVLNYSTYLGGSGADKGNGITVDSFGNAYIIGTTSSTDFPLNNFPPANPALQQINKGRFDIFLTKLNPAGSGLDYSTYLGGSGDDVGTGIAVDGSGNITFTGYTNSTNFPMINPLQGTYGGGNADAIVGKLNPSGNLLAYSTYLGGNSDDFGFGVALDGAGNAYITGGTASTNFLTTAGAAQASITYQNVFKSLDSGASWGSSNSGILDASVVAWAFDPTTSGTLFAGTFGTGVYRSTNSGASWTQVSSGLTNVNVNTLVSDGSGNIFAGTAGGGIFRLAKGASTWTPASTGLTNTTVQTLAISSSGVLFAGTAGGMFTSNNGGGSWTPINTGFTNINVTKPDITAIAIDRNNANIVYAGTAGGGVFKSTNAGALWTPIVNGLSNFNISAIAIDPTSSSTIYAATHGNGVFISTNSGLTWSSFDIKHLDIVDPSFRKSLKNVSPFFWDVNVTALAIDSFGTPYAGTDAGVFKFDATLGSWTLSNLNLTNLAVSALAVDPFNPTTLFAGSRMTADAFATKLAPSGATAVYSTYLGGRLDDQGHGITVDNAGNAFLTGYTTSIDFNVTPATAFQRNNGDQKSFKTADGGATWTPNDTGGLPRGSLQTLAVDPNTRDTVYAGMLGSGVFKSTNGGATWTNSSTGLSNLSVNILVVDRLKPLEVYAGTDNGIQKSTDGGATWQPTPINLVGETVTSLDIIPQIAPTPSILFAGTRSGVFRSTDGGATWIAIDNGLPNSAVTEIAVDQSSPNIVYLGTESAGVFTTGNALQAPPGSVQWSPYNLGLPGATDPNSIIDITALTFTASGRPFIGVNNGSVGVGIFTPDQNGAWAPATSGLKDPNVTFLIAHPTNSLILYAGTQNGGIFTTTSGGGGWTQDNGSAKIDGNNRLTNFEVETIAIARTDTQTIYAGFHQSLIPTADVFITQLNTAGALSYSTYLGGNGNDVGQGIARIAGDPSSNVFLTGYTASGAFPLLFPLQNQSVIHAGGTFHYDAFVTKINTATSKLGYSTFVGGGSATSKLPIRNPEGDDYGNAIAVDSDGSAVVVGNTTSLDFPTTDTAFQAGFGGGTNQGDAFVTRIAANGGVDFSTGLFPNGAPPFFSTYLGGTGDDSANGVALDPSGNIYVTGFTGSTKFPTVNPAQASPGGDSTGAVFTDAFVAKIVPIPTTVTLTIQTSPSSLGAQFVDVTLSAFLFTPSSAPFGTAFYSGTFFDGPVALGQFIEDGKGNAVITIRGVSTAATHEYFYYFGGDKNHLPSKSLPITLVPTVTQLTSSGPGASASYTATVVPTTGGGVPTGYVTFMVGGTVSPGQPPISTFMSGGTVLPGQPGINPPVPGNPNVPGPDEGDGTVVQSGVPLVNGTATYTPPTPLTPGSYTITAVYSGDLSFLPSTSAQLAQAAPGVATSVAISASPTASVFGQPVTFTAIVSSLTPGSGIPTGTLRFEDSGTVLGTAALDAAGSASFTTTAPLSVGTHSITAFYQGGGVFSTSSSPILNFIVAKASTTTALNSSPTPPVSGQPLTLTATVTVVAPGAGTPTGSVTFMDGMATLGSAVVSSTGTATFTIANLTPGGHGFTAIYSGDNSFSGSTSPPLSLGPTQTTLSVSPTRPAVGQQVTLTATVTPLPPATGNPTGTVRFLDGGTLLATATLNAGVATLQISSLAAGNHAITANYIGDNFFGPSSSNVVNVVVASTVSAQLTSAPNPSGVGQPVTITMTVTGSPNGPVPTGTVQFVIDMSNFGGPVNLDSTGTASISTSGLAFGPHTITATYSGNSVYASATAGPLTQTVQFGSSVVVSSSANPSALGAPVTFTATVAAVPPGQGTPTGNVTFMDGTTALATVALNSSGIASFTTRKLTAGNHPITAVYSGDANFAPNTSAPLLQGVSLNAIFATGADAGGGPNVLVFDSLTDAVKFNFFAYAPSFTGGVRVAVGDVNGDGFPDVITAPGPGGGPDIHVYDGKTGNLIRQFFAYDPRFSGGQYIAAGDLNGDGFADIIVGADKGGGPNVIAFSGKDGTVLFNFMAYDIRFTGGVRVGAGDVNGDGHDDIIAVPGPGGGPNVTIFSGTNGAVLSSFFAFNMFQSNGMFVAAGDTDGSGVDKVIVTLDAGVGPTVGVYDGILGVQLQAFYAYDPQFTGGVRVGVSINKSGRADILTVAGPGGGADVRTFSGVNDQLIDQFFAYDPRFTGGLFVAGGR